MSEPEDTGLFGKLPRTRPGMRSPRRTAGGTGSKATEAARPKAEPTAAAAGATKPRSAPRPGPAAPARPRPEPRAPAAGEEQQEPGERGAGLEELAWAGIAVTAEAATLGVRLMSRALDAARRATERG